MSQLSSRLSKKKKKNSQADCHLSRVHRWLCQSDLDPMKWLYGATNISVWDVKLERLNSEKVKSLKVKKFSNPIIEIKKKNF